jgi:hypothetical protein
MAIEVGHYRLTPPGDDGVPDIKECRCSNCKYVTIYGPLEAYAIAGIVVNEMYYCTHTLGLYSVDPNGVCPGYQKKVFVSCPRPGEQHEK